jgi:hypothetical protein
MSIDFYINHNNFSAGWFRGEDWCLLHLDLFLLSPELKSLYIINLSFLKFNLCWAIDWENHA